MAFTSFKNLNEIVKTYKLYYDSKEGWVQCVAQLMAMQKLNKDKGNFTLFGIVTNGELWEFACLTNNKLFKNTIAFSVFDIKPIYGAVDFVMKSCSDQILSVETPSV